MSSSPTSAIRSRTRGLIATGLVVAIAAGVAGAALIDVGGDGGASSTNAGTATRTGTATTKAAPSFFGQISSLPAVRPGELRGRILVAGADCRVAWIDLGTLRAVDVPDRVRACRDQRSAFIPPGSDVLVLTRPSVPGGSAIHLGRNWALGEQTPDGVALCAPGGRAMLVLFAGGRRSLPSCPIGELDARLVFLSSPRTLVDEAGRVVLRLRRPFERDGLRQLSSGIVVVESFGREGADLYVRGRLLGTVPIKRAGDECAVGSVSRDGRVVLGRCGPGGALVVFHDGTSRDVNPLLASMDAVLSPDGRSIIDPLPAGGDALIIDAATLAPLARLRIGGAGMPVDWRQ